MVRERERRKGSHCQCFKHNAWPHICQRLAFTMHTCAIQDVSHNPVSHSDTKGNSWHVLSTIHWAFDNQA